MSDKVAKKLELLKKITFYVVSTFVMVIAVITLVVIKFLFVKANTDGSYLIRYATLSFLILYMTANLLQRKIITTIFQQ